MRVWIRVLLAAGLILASSAGRSRAATRDSGSKPNIIIILADDMGYSDVGCFGGEIHTPNIDSLAKDGTRFTNFYNNARCCPTRASILTGLYAHQAGIGEMTEKTDKPGYLGALKPTAPTIAEVLKADGYATAMFGKWHVSNTFEDADHMAELNRLKFPEFFSPIEQYPTHRGFDVFWGDIWGVVNYYNPYSLVDGDKPVEKLPDKFFVTDAINQHATDYINDHAKSSQPFFMYLAHHAPHWPLHAPPENIAKYRDQYNDGYEPVRQARYKRMIQMGLIDPKTAPLPGPLGMDDWNKFSPAEKRFHAGLYQTHAAMIDRMDEGLGNVFAALKSAGKWENTLIFFLSDNGASDERYEDPGFDRATIARDGQPIDYHYDDMSRLAGPEHTWYYIGRDWAHVANTPYRKWKASQYNGGERTPMIVHWPNGLKHPAGSMIGQRGHVIDLMATAVDLAGATMPAEFGGATPHPLEGTSLVPLLDGQNTLPNYPTLFNEHEGGRSVMTADGWKLIRDRGESEWHLYNLNTDATEMTDLISKEPDRVAKMKQMWEDWAKANNVLPKP